MDFNYESNQITARGADGKLLAQITFPDVDSETVDINHTFVDSSLQGQGIAGQLVQAAANTLRIRKKKAVVSCSYAVRWFEKHQEYEDILKK